MRDVGLPRLEVAAGKKAGRDFGLCVNPEFMREGTAVWDFRHPPKTVIGEIDERSGDTLLQLYLGIDAPVIRTRIEIAEMVKYTDNAWHAVKVAFANEIGNISKASGVDGQSVMEIFCKDTKLNLSSYYLRPGFAFGGSCLPKDLRALTYKGRMLDLELPLLSSVLRSNQVQLEKGIRMVLDKGHRRVGVLGISFKAGTDDLRESPLVDLIEHLLGKGCELKVYDRNVRLAALMGANRDFIMNRIPHIAALLAPDMAQVVQFADTVVIEASGKPHHCSPRPRMPPMPPVLQGGTSPTSTTTTGDTAPYKLRGLAEKHILRMAMKSELPGSIARRPKQPYRAPDSSSFFSDGKPLDYVRELLSPVRIRAAGIFDARAISKLVAKCGSGRALGFGDNMAFVRALSTVRLHEQFVAPARGPQPLS